MFALKSVGTFLGGRRKTSVVNRKAPRNKRKGQLGDTLKNLGGGEAMPLHGENEPVTSGEPS